MNDDNDVIDLKGASIGRLALSIHEAHYRDPIRYTPINNVGGLSSLINIPVDLIGYNLAALAATFAVLIDGEDPGGPIVGALDLGAAGSASHSIPDGGVRCLGGVSVSVSGAALFGAIYWRPVPRQYWT